MRRRGKLQGLIPAYCGILSVFLLTAVFGSNAATLASQNQPIQRDYCIVIDAGHGSPDGGATSSSGVLESEINLQIARRLNDLLCLLGLDTVMVRSSEESVFTEGNTIAAKKISDLKNRVALINRTEGAVLVSIHQNYFNDSRYSGAQVFYAQTQGSRELAEHLQESLMEYLDPSNRRQVKKADGVYLLEKVTCTGVLVECGFLSNPEEDAKLQNAQYQKKICCALASAIDSYLHAAGTVA